MRASSEDSVRQSLQRLEAFAQRLLDPDDLGWSCSSEVRQAARQALGVAVAPATAPATVDPSYGSGLSRTEVLAEV